MSALKALTELVFPAEYGPSVIVLGDSKSGKSSIVSALSGQLERLVPSIGIDRSSHTVRIGPEEVLWLAAFDPAGSNCEDPRTIGLLWAPLVVATSAIVWVVDSSQTDLKNLERSRDALIDIVNAIDEKKKQEGYNRKLPVLILANKQDISDVTSIDEIRKTFKSFTDSHTSIVMPTCAVAQRSYEESGLKVAMSWFGAFLNSYTSVRTRETLIFEKKSKYTRKLIDRVTLWVHKLNHDVNDEEFIKLFDTFALPSWDHYTHVRIAYLLLRNYGRQEGKDRIFEGLKAYITQSPANTNRVFHFTLTYFWIQNVWLGIQVQNLEVEKATHGGETTTIPYLLPSLEKERFAHFLLLNPYVADGTLWSKYYSLERWTDPSARTSMVLPDKKMLPNVVARGAV